MTTGAPLDLENFVTFRVSRLADTISRAANQIYSERFGINLTDWRVLAILSRHQPTTAMDLSRRSRIDKAWISRSLADLEARDLIRRQPNPKDKRSALLTLSRAGTALVKKVAPLSKHRHERLLSGLSPDERNALIRLLEFMQSRADELSEKPD